MWSLMSHRQCFWLAIDMQERPLLPVIYLIWWLLVEVGLFRNYRTKKSGERNLKDVTQSNAKVHAAKMNEFIISHGEKFDSGSLSPCISFPQNEHALNFYMVGILQNHSLPPANKFSIHICCETDEHSSQTNLIPHA